MPKLSTLMGENWPIGGQGEQQLVVQIMVLRRVVDEAQFVAFMRRSVSDMSVALATVDAASIWDSMLGSPKLMRDLWVYRHRLRRVARREPLAAWIRPKATAAYFRFAYDELEKFRTHLENIDLTA